MKAARIITLLSLAVLCCIIVFGCGKEDGGTTGTTTEPKVNGDVEEKDVEELRAAALKCKAAVEAKIAESNEKSQELMKALGSKPEEKAKLQAEVAELSKATEELVKQLNTYIAQIKAKGGDVSDLEIK